MNPDQNADQPAIEFRNVFLSFDDHVVLKDISFTLDQGEMIFSPVSQDPANQYCCVWQWVC